MSVNERWLEILLTPLRDGISVAETCRRYGVSRQSFYDYRRRLDSEGVTALQPRSRRPHRSPAQTAPDIETRIVEMRTHNPRWAPAPSILDSYEPGWRGRRRSPRSTGSCNATDW